MLRIGIDTGGTFTDFVVLEKGRLEVFKLPSTPSQPEKAVIEGLTRILEGKRASDFLIQHGSTVATNALLERRGARTLLITTQGFEDVLEIGRQNRPGLYRLGPSRAEPLVPARLRIGLKERRAWDGSDLVPLEPSSLAWIARKVESLAPEAVAVVLLYSYVNPDNELAVEEALKKLGIPISLSHRIHPEFREFERTSATTINAYLSPVMSTYLSQLSGAPAVKEGRLSVMQSNGGAISARFAGEQPIRTLFSGPAGGVTGSFELAKAMGLKKIITLDMGGTSTDVSLCDGEISTTTETAIDQMPIPIPMISIHTVGTGGGSIAWVDSGGLLRVGPKSAGADPGPVCYGSGRDITVTDANLFLGLLDADFFLDGKFALSPGRVKPALRKLGDKLKTGTQRPWDPVEISEGIREIVNTQLEAAVRVISLERGYDTRDFALIGFGGAAALHACDLARSLLIPQVVVPAHPGLLSALGILQANVVRDASKTVLIRTDEANHVKRLQQSFSPLMDQVRKELNEDGFSGKTLRIETSVDCRYPGQSYELNIPFNNDFKERFHERHHQFYGHSNSQLPVEVVTVRVVGTGLVEPPEFPKVRSGPEKPTDDALIKEKRLSIKGQKVPVRFYNRRKLQAGNRIEGASVILEYSSTTYVPQDFIASVDELMNLVLIPR